MGEDVLLYLPSTAKAIQLNESSRIVWQLCDGERSVGEIIDEISRLYPDQAAQIPDDVLLATKMLVGSGALELTN
jgi:hypothetical protein